jgi:hypothetical protein
LKFNDITRSQFKCLTCRNTKSIRGVRNIQITSAEFTTLIEEETKISATIVNAYSLRSRMQVIQTFPSFRRGLVLWSVAWSTGVEHMEQYRAMQKLHCVVNVNLLATNFEDDEMDDANLDLDIPIPQPIFVGDYQHAHLHTHAPIGHLVYHLGPTAPQ